MIVVFFLCFSPFVVAASEKTLPSYTWGKTVSLKGQLVVQTVSGPPEYGEVATEGRGSQIWILKLEKPISVEGLSYGVNSSLSGVNEVQLINAVSRMPMECLVAQGVLFEAISGHHRTPALLDVTDWQECKE